MLANGGAKESLESTKGSRKGDHTWVTGALMRAIWFNERSILIFNEVNPLLVGPKEDDRLEIAHQDCVILFDFDCFAKGQGEGREIGQGMSTAC